MLFQKNKLIITYSLIVLFALQIIAAPLYSFRSQFIVVDNDYESMLFANFDSLSDIEQTLTASGVEPNLFPLYSTEIMRWKQEIQDSLPANATQRQIAIGIGEYLHDNVFIRYKLSATTLKEIFEEGLFNCLSATILVNILLRSFGIQTQSIVLPTHVYTLAMLDGKASEIENTIRNGLSISEDANAQKRFNELTGFDYKSTNSKKVPISWFQTVGLLYSNRSYFDAKRKDHDRAFQNMIKAQVFLSEAPSEFNNLSAGYLNYSYYAYNNNRQPLQKYLKTLSILEEGIGRFPTYDNLRGNYLKGVDLVIEKMVATDSDSQTIDQILTKSQQYLKANDFQKIQKGRYIRSALFSLRTNINFPKALESVNKLKEVAPNDKDTQSLMEEYAYTRVKTILADLEYPKIDNSVIQEMQQFPPKVIETSLGCYFTGIAEKQFKQKLFDDSLSTMKSAKNILGNTKMVTQNGFAYAINAAQFNLQNDNTLDTLKYYKKSLEFKKDRQVINNMSILYDQLIRTYIANNDFKKAQELMNDGMAVLPNNPRLRNLAEEYSFN